MGFFDKLQSFASYACASQARRYESAARYGRVGDHKLTDSQREFAREKAARFREMSERYRPSDD